MDDKKEVVVENTEEKKEVAIKVKEKENEVILKTPITYDNVKYERLVFDVQSISGRDLIEIQTDMKLAGIPLTSSMLIDEAYLARIAAKASGVELEVVESLKLKDFRSVVNKISGLMM